LLAAKGFECASSRDPQSTRHG